MDAQGGKTIFCKMARPGQGEGKRGQGMVRAGYLEIYLELSLEEGGGAKNVPIFTIKMFTKPFIGRGVQVDETMFTKFVVNLFGMRPLLL